MNDAVDHSRPPYVAMSLIAGSLLILQITLMRLMSVTLWYHFAFMMISLALLGSGIAAATIYRWPDWWRKNTDRLHIISTALFTVSLVVCPALYLALPLEVTVSVTGAIHLALTIMIFLIPFSLGGLVIASLIARHPEQVSRLYFADLGGAALGALATVGLLKLFSAQVVLIGLGLLPLVALFDLWPRQVQYISSHKSFMRWAGCALVVWVVGLSLLGTDLYQVRYTKTKDETRPLWERWNPLARITVLPGAALGMTGNFGFGWALSSTWVPKQVDQMWIEQDASAGTPITRFDGSFEGLDHLGLDVTSFGYDVFAPETVCIIGPGGGRDVLTALYFDVESIDAIELNPDIVEAVNEVYGEFSGHIYSHPKVHVHIDEARGFLTHEDAQYDLLQISMIDSWAASLSGAFSLAENNLYTVEAFTLFLNRLNESGVLSVSRWYYGTTQAETIRLVSLSVAALKRLGVADPLAHLAVIQNDNVATALVKKTPLTDAEIDGILLRVSELQYRTLWIPHQDNLLPSPLFKYLSNIDNPSALGETFNFDYSAPTDDRPFFFQMRRGLTFSATEATTGDWKASSIGVFTLSILLVVLFVLSLFFVLGPLLSRSPEGTTPLAFWRSHAKPLLYFMGIGFGFLAIEIALIQRYVLYLGHPIYAVTIVIFSLLLGSALGSFLSEKWTAAKLTSRTHSRAMLIILALALVQTLGTSSLFAITQGWPWFTRALVSVALMLTFGVALGAGFPMGIARLRTELGTSGIAWMWGVNTVCSVLASALAIMIAVHYGYTAALFFGIASYALCWATARLPWGVNH
jgi:Spermine/spermidine synthase domain